MKLMFEVVLAAALDWTLIVRIKSHPYSCFTAHTAAELSVTTSTHGTAVREEEVEEFVRDSKMGRLLKLLESGKTDQHFEERQRCLDWW
jgi:hypothetical protein